MAWSITIISFMPLNVSLNDRFLCLISAGMHPGRKHRFVEKGRCVPGFFFSSRGWCLLGTMKADRTKAVPIRQAWHSIDPWAAAGHDESKAVYELEADTE